MTKIEKITLSEFLNKHINDYVYLKVDDGESTREVCDVAVKYLHLWVLNEYGFCLVDATRRNIGNSKYDIYDVIIKENNN